MCQRGLQFAEVLLSSQRKMIFSRGRSNTRSSDLADQRDREEHCICWNLQHRGEVAHGKFADSLIERTQVIGCVHRWTRTRSKRLNFRRLHCLCCSWKDRLQRRKSMAE